MATSWLARRLLGWGTDPLGVEEATRSLTKKLAGPAIVSRNSPPVVRRRSVLLDAVGRNVMSPGRGSHDARALAPGVHFVREPKRNPKSKLPAR